MKMIKSRIVVLCFVVLLICSVYPCLTHLNLACKVFCGNGLCLTCDGRIAAAINGEKNKWPYFIVDFNECSSNAWNVFSSGLGEYAGSAIDNKPMPVRWVVIHDNRKFPFGELYWFSENAVLVSNNGLWDKLSLFGRWLLLSETALNCTCDVRNDIKGLDAELAITNHEDCRRYVWSSAERHSTNVISSVDIPAKLFAGYPRQ